MLYSEVVFKDFSAGLVTEDPDGERPPGAARRLLNLLNDQRGRLRYPGGFRVLVANSAVPAFTRYVSTSGTRRLVYVDDPGAGFAKLWKERNESGGLTNTLLTDLGAGNTGFSMAQMGDKVFVTDRATSLRAWRGVGAAYTAGMENLKRSTVYIQPFVTETVGLPDSSQGDRYSYAYQFYDSSRNVYSDFSATSYAVDAVLRQVRLEAYYKDASGAATLPPGVDKIRVFRRGGLASQMRFLFETTPYIMSVAGQVGDATTNTFLMDNFADRNQSLEVASESNLRPPKGLVGIFVHQNRLCGYGPSLTDESGAVVGDGSDLWVSRPGQPESWGYDDNGVDDDGGRIRIDNNPADPILSHASTGALAILGRAQSVYALYGNAFRNFAADQRSDVGVAGPKAMTRLWNSVYYLGNDRKVYQVGDGDSKPLSDRIAPTLEAIPESLLAGAALWSHMGFLFVSVPQAGAALPYTFALDARSGAWLDRSASHLAALAAGSLVPASGSGAAEMVVARTSGQGGGILVCDSPGDLTSLPIYLATDWQRVGDAGEVGAASSVYVEGRLTEDALAPVYVRVSARYTNRLGVQTVTSSDFRILSAANRRILSVPALPPNLIGQEVSAEIFGNIAAGSIQRIVIGMGFLWEGG